MIMPLTVRCISIIQLTAVLILFQFGGLGFIFMPSLLGITRRLLYTMANETYKAGTHSMAFVTVPNEEVAKKLAG